VAVRAVAQVTTETATREGTAAVTPGTVMPKTRDLGRPIDSFRENRSVLPLRGSLDFNPQRPVYPVLRAVPQSSPKRNWIKRHPVLFGTLVGFSTGFLIGVAAGDDGVIDDETAVANGWIVGGIGAASGAAVGSIFSR
jgi:hypothetical protein